ncbi:MAG: hypothetical protein QHC90_22090 [Shinella sp.]|nr:hypothetical protein [Shinella sp.]
MSISLSAAAVLHLSQMKASTALDAHAAYFTQFFSSRDGYETNGLGAASANPGTFSSSAGLSIEQAAADACVRMDTKYATMKESGEPFSWQSAEGRDRNALFGDLNRRSLLAVRENVGGLFTKEEQAAAFKLMNQQ